MNWGLKLKLSTLVALGILASVSIYIVFKENRNGILTVAFLNVGQGDAIFIESPSGNQMLIDGGPGRSVLREISKVMPFYDRSIDVLVATHPDADHTGGMLDLLDKYKISLFMEPGMEGDTALYKEISSKVEKLNIKKLEARRGMTVELGKGAILEILFPVVDPEGMETNAASIVARLVYGENEFLLTGDSPINIEKYLVSLKIKLESDVLKAGHHGSRTSTSPEFISVANPQYVVISSGKNNRYGHPHPEVLNTLQNFGAKVLRTDEQGRIIFKSDGVNLKIK